MMKQNQHQKTQVGPEVKRKTKLRAVQASKAHQNAAKFPQKSHVDKNLDIISTIDKSVISSRTSVSRVSFDSDTDFVQEQTKKANNVPSKKIRLYFENSRKYKNFRLYSEDDIDLSICDNASSKFEDPVGDNDSMTDGEQIKSSLRKINSSLKNGLKEFFENKREIENLVKYKKRKLK